MILALTELIAIKPAVWIIATHLRHQSLVVTRHARVCLVCIFLWQIRSLHFIHFLATSPIQFFTLREDHFLSTQELILSIFQIYLYRKIFLHLEIWNFDLSHFILFARISCDSTSKGFTKIKKPYRGMEVVPALFRSDVIYLMLVCLLAWWFHIPDFSLLRCLLNLEIKGKLPQFSFIFLHTSATKPTYFLSWIVLCITFWFLGCLISLKTRASRRLKYLKARKHSFLCQGIGSFGLNQRGFLNSKSVLLLLKECSVKEWLAAHLNPPGTGL